MEAYVPVEPKEVDSGGEESDGHGTFVVLVIVEGGIAYVLRPGISGETSHLINLILYPSPIYSSIAFKPRSPHSKR